VYRGGVVNFQAVTTISGGYTLLKISDDGTVFIFKQTSTNDLYAITYSGGLWNTLTKIHTNARAYTSIVFSPDGTKIIFAAADGYTGVSSTYSYIYAISAISIAQNTWQTSQLISSIVQLATQTSGVMNGIYVRFLIPVYITNEGIGLYAASAYINNRWTGYYYRTVFENSAWSIETTPVYIADPVLDGVNSSSPAVEGGVFAYKYTTSQHMVIVWNSVYYHDTLTSVKIITITNNIIEFTTVATPYSAGQATGSGNPVFLISADLCTIIQFVGYRNDYAYDGICVYTFRTSISSNAWSSFTEVARGPGYGWPYGQLPQMYTYWGGRWSGYALSGDKTILLIGAYNGSNSDGKGSIYMATYNGTAWTYNPTPIISGTSTTQKLGSEIIFINNTRWLVGQYSSGSSTGLNYYGLLKNDNGVWSLETTTLPFRSIFSKSNTTAVYPSSSPVIYFKT